MNHEGKANLRVSYLGGGYDFPQFFEDKPVTIIAEALPLSVTCIITENMVVRWCLPKNLGSGLGSSAARHLSFIRAKFPEAGWNEHINAGITLDGLQAGGWQDTITSAYDGLIKIVLHRGEWNVYPLLDMNLAIHRYRKLYKIPVAAAPTKILTSRQCRESSFEAMQELVADGEQALMKFDLPDFGLAITVAWILKKQWHPEISNDAITEMEKAAKDAGAWGWKVCGAGGQGYFLVIADRDCHETLKRKYTEFKITEV